MLWETIVAIFVVLSGMSAVAIGETNTMRTFAIDKNMLGEQMAEWTAYSQYETGQGTSRNLSELGRSFRITVSGHDAGSCRGIDINVTGETPNQKDTLFIPRCL